MRTRVRDARVAHLATVTADGRPHVVPCCFVLVDDVVYSAVDAKPKSTLALRRLDNLRARPHASLLVDHYDDDWSTLWWIRVDGNARILTAGDERTRAIFALIQKYEEYEHMAPMDAVIAIDVAQWRAWP